MFWELTIKCKTWSTVKLYEYEQVKLKAYYHLMAQYIFCIKPSQLNLLQFPSSKKITLKCWPLRLTFSQASQKGLSTDLM